MNIKDAPVGTIFKRDMGKTFNFYLKIQSGKFVGLNSTRSNNYRLVDIGILPKEMEYVGNLSDFVSLLEEKVK